MTGVTNEGSAAGLEARIDAVSGLVYGTIAVGLVLAAEDPVHSGYPTVVEAAAVSLALYWIAHSYAAILARRLARGQETSWAAVRGTLRHELPIVVGGALPIVVLAVEWLLGVRLRTAVLAALWTCVGALFLLELAAGLRARRGPAQALGGAMVGASLGLALLVVKALLH